MAWLCIWFGILILAVACGSMGLDKIENQWRTWWGLCCCAEDGFRWQNVTEMVREKEEYTYFFNMFIQTIPLFNFNSIWKTFPFWSTDIIIVALFCFSSVFFLRYHLLFSFAHFFHKIVKPKGKTSFSKMLKDYICYIFCYMRGFQKYIPFKK